jgi:hypothetical protein
MCNEFGSDGGFSSSSTYECMQQRHERLQMLQAGACAGGSSCAAGSYCHGNAYSYLPGAQHADAAMHLPVNSEQHNAPQHVPMQPLQQQQHQQQQPKQKLPAHLATKRFCLDLSDEALGSTPAAAADGSS